MDLSYCFTSEKTIDLLQVTALQFLIATAFPSRYYGFQQGFLPPIQGAFTFMKEPADLKKALVKTGVIAGLAVSVMYPARTFLPLPTVVIVAFFIYFGPLVLVAMIGIYPFLTKIRTSVPAILGTVFGVIYGIVQPMFAVVQLTNLHYIREQIGSAADAASKQEWTNILRGVFTVQAGLNWVADLFLDWSIFMFAIVMWNHPKFGRFFSLAGLVAAGSHFVLKAYTFPVPPKEAGLIDVGPLVSIWYALVVIQILRHIKWMDS